MTWAVVKMHSEASAMMVERRGEVFILKGVGLLFLLLLLGIWELGRCFLESLVGSFGESMVGWFV